jgi:hypothetical protein
VGRREGEGAICIYDHGLLTERVGGVEGLAEATTCETIQAEGRHTHVIEDGGPLGLPNAYTISPMEQDHRGPTLKILVGHMEFPPGHDGRQSEIPPDQTARPLLHEGIGWESG